MSFIDLGLSEPIVRAVAAEGYTAPTPIQAQAIPHALAGRDVLGCAQTGTGKTCAFALPILQRLTPEARDGERQGGRKPMHGGRAPRALILAPTRELASQILESFIAYGRGLPLRHTAIFGGVSQSRQVAAMRGGVDVVIATPGRLLDLINQGCVDLRSIEVLVLDEADRMLDMGFINDIRKIVAMVPKERQTLLFSATVSPEIRSLVDSMLRDPVHVQTARESATADMVTQSVYMIERAKKPLLLEHLLRQGDVGRTLVFTRTKHGADRLVKFLHGAGINAEAIHGNKSQNARTRAMQGFRNGATRVLVATDIASRGIDVDDITHVVNFDMPIDAETYVHRIGRTARAGASGIAVSFCDRDEKGVLGAIERRTQIRLTVARDFPDFAALIASRPPRIQPAAPITQERAPRQNTSKPGGPRRVRNSRPANGAGHTDASGNSRPSSMTGAQQRTRRRKPHRGQTNASHS